MKKVLFISVMAFMLLSKTNGQIVSTKSNTGSGINDAILYSEDGSITGTDHEGNSVYKLMPGGTLTTLTSGINAPNGLERDAAGNIYIGAPKENKIYKLSSSGTLSVYIPNILNPNNLLFLKNTDTLLVASYVYNKIYKVAPDGNITTIFDGTPLNGPLGMTYDNENNLYIANFTDGKIFKVTNNNLVLFATVPGAVVDGLQAAIGFIKYINGYIYATGFGKCKIYRITLAGEVQEFAGSGIAGTVDGTAAQARFNWPNGITCNAAGTEIFISEYKSHAVRSITSFATKVEPAPKSYPTSYILKQNYPNPFNPNTQIAYQLPEKSFVSLKVYDILGNETETLASGIKEAGYYECRFDGNDLASGTYIYRLSVNGMNIAKKMVLLK